MKIIFTIMFFISFNTFGFDQDKNEILESQIKELLIQEKKALDQLEKCDSKNLESSYLDYAKCIWYSTKKILCCCCEYPEFNPYKEVKKIDGNPDPTQTQFSGCKIKELDLGTVSIYPEIKIQLPPEQKIKIIEVEDKDKDKDFYEIIGQKNVDTLVFTQTF